MTEKETLFFEWFDKVEEYATRHDYTINQVVNVRQSWDEGYAAAEKRIIEWIEANRSLTEVEAGVNIVRDHFNSESLIAFIKGENK